MGSRWSQEPARRTTLPAYLIPAPAAAIAGAGPGSAQRSTRRKLDALHPDDLGHPGVPGAAAIAAAAVLSLSRGGLTDPGGGSQPDRPEGGQPDRDRGGQSDRRRS